LSDEIKEVKKVLRPKGRRPYLKRAFIKGVAGILPTLLTIVILVWCYQFVRNYVGVYVNTVAEWVIRAVGLEEGILKLNNAIANRVDEHVAPADPVTDPKIDELALRPVTGIVLSLLLIYVIGFFISTFLGRRLLPRIEKMILRLPVVKAVYPYARQVTDFFLGEQAIHYERIVAVEYPRKGVYSLGFVTNDGIRTVCDKVDRQLLVVFVPSSPTPVTGYTIMIRPEETIPISMSIDDALRMAISGGVIIPENQRMPRGKAKTLHIGTAPPIPAASPEGDETPERE